MKRTLFVLDFDGTYDNEDKDGLGVAPMVYLIPEHAQSKVEKLAFAASKTFHNSTDDRCIGDYFENFLINAQIPYREVGELQIPFGERWTDYLPDYIPRAIV